MAHFFNMNKIDKDRSVKIWAGFKSKKQAETFLTTFTDIQDRPGIYLTRPGSNFVWAGFKSKKQAETCLLVLPGWKICIRR